MSWRKKPIVIDAVQYTGKVEELPYEMGVTITRSTENGSCFLHTLEGEMECKVGDFIIKGIKGELYPCKPDIFLATYEHVDQESPVDIQVEKEPIIVSSVRVATPSGLKSGVDKELEDVRAFHDKFGFLNNHRYPTMVAKRKLRERAECIQEELDEFKAAIETQDFAEQADALIDIVYFVKGTAVQMGLPWEDLWDDVQRANISKERGVTKRGHAFDVKKPEGWVPPNGKAILLEHGFDESKFITDGQIDESKCADDSNN